MIQLQILGETIEEEVAEVKALIGGGAVPRSIYDDVAELQSKVSEIESKLEDTGWLSLPLCEGVEAQNSNTYPCRYRKIGSRVFVQGCVKGFVDVLKDIAILPEGFRPSKEYYYQGVTNAGKTDTFRFYTNGTIERMATTMPNPSANNYHFITTSFLVD